MSKPKILVVDDEPTSFDVIEGVLYREPYVLHYASSGKEALRRLDTLKPDLLLLDMMMPQMDGASVCQTLRATPEWQHLPVIMVTALNSKEDLYTCLEAGADDFIGKPVNALELRARVRAMLRIKSQYDALVTARDRVENLLQAREDLAHTIVHDLRHPVTTILFACELLLHAGLAAPLEKRLQIMKSEAHRLSDMLNDLLLAAKIEANQFQLQREPIDLADMLRVTLVSWQDVAEQKQVSIQAEIAPDLPRLNLDAGLMRRVLDNLLTNALKFAPTQSCITVSISATADQVLLRIADQGQGIDPSQAEAIFAKFVTGDALASTAHIGLGLAFCQQAIQAHNGTITYKANEPRGAIFQIALPRDDHAVLAS